IYDNFNILDPTSSKYEEQKKDLLLENPLHSYGHRIERIMKYIFQNRKSYSFELNADKSIKVISKNIKSNEFDLFYSYYYRQTYEENGLKPPSFSNNDINNAHCGEIHFPPNTDTSYDYRNEINKVYSDCNLLYMYYPETTNPNLEIFQNQKDYINCDPWGCTMYGYQKWWMKHIPNFEGGHENAFDLGPSLILNNWWRYISNPQKLVEIVNEMIYTGPGFVQMNSEAKIT
ncbi:hypothetical protein HOC11_00515, partial [archaeon]|nr:hypothetical protein [archaeon]